MRGLKSGSLPAPTERQAELGWFMNHQWGRGARVLGAAVLYGIRECAAVVGRRCMTAAHLFVFLEHSCLAASIAQGTRGACHAAAHH